MKITYITLLTIFLFVFNIQSVYADNFKYGYTSSGYKYVIHEHNESSYQHAWCSMRNGIEEYVNKDKTRVDCLTDTHAVEFDFANKWAESIGQALHYQYITNKRAKVVLILENPKKQMVYYNRINRLAQIHDFDAEYITPDILVLNNGKCPYNECKCHFNKKTSFINKIRYFFQVIISHNLNRKIQHL